MHPSPDTTVSGSDARRQDEQPDSFHRALSTTSAVQGLDAAGVKGPDDAQRLNWIQAYIRRYGRTPEFHPNNTDLRSAIDRAIAIDPLGVPAAEPPKRHSLCGKCMTPHICAEDGPGCTPGVRVDALYDAETPPVGIFALRDAVRCLRDTGRFVDEEGEATNALSDLLDRLTDGVSASDDQTNSAAITTPGATS